MFPISTSCSYVNSSVKIFSVEGNIGSGKSTLIKKLKSEMKYICNSDACEIVNYLPEPVNIWESIKDKDGKNIIEKFYADQGKYAFSFQMMAYISRLHQLKEKINQGSSIIITERSIYTDRNVFAKMLYDNDLIEDVNYDIYLRWFDEFVKDIPMCKFIYVKTAPEKCDERVHKRNRKGETIPLDYLKRCDEYHNNWLDQYNDKLILDGNIEYIDNLPEEWKTKITDFIKRS